MPWSHYDFRATCGRSCLDLVNKWPTRNRYKNVGRDEKTTAKESDVFGNYALDPEHDTLNGRLDISLPRLPKVASTNKNSEPKTCQLHVWSDKEVGLNK